MHPATLHAQLNNLLRNGKPFQERESSNGHYIMRAGRQINIGRIRIRNYLQTTLNGIETTSMHYEIKESGKYKYLAQRKNKVYRAELIQYGKWAETLEIKPFENEFSFDREYNKVRKLAEQLALAGTHFCETCQFEKSTRTIIGRIYQDEELEVILKRTERRGKRTRNCSEISVSYC